MKTSTAIVALLGMHAWAFAAPIQPLEKLENCTFVPTGWADGDSFRIKTANGEEHTVRLYGVDCLELHLGDSRNIARFREQRRYFGIADAGNTSEESMNIAHAFAKQAADLTADSLRKPFTLHTRFSDGGGDPAYKRILGFITLADGKDLGAILIQQGLARAQGIMSTMPDGTSLVEARGLLEDWELQALKMGRGIWAKTDWEKLPAERQLLRKEMAEAKIAKDQNASGPNGTIDPNTATKTELMNLPGIGEELADRIIESREDDPFRKPEDLMRIPGIKQKTLKKFSAHLEFKKP